MARPLRFVPPDALVEVTTRTIHGRFLLRPSSNLNELILGVIGRAQHLFGVEIHAFVALSNHMHLLLTVRDAAQLAAFMSFVNGNIAREAGRLHHWRERFWGRRYRAIVVADGAAQVDRLRYILENGVKEGLVPSPLLWPGCSSAAALTTGAPLLGTWHNRAGEYRARRRGEEIKPSDFQTFYPVTLSPMPCWRHLDLGEHRKSCADLVAGIEAEAKAKAGRDDDRQPVGAARVLAADPHGMPVHFDSSPAPFVHASSAPVRGAFRAAYRAFVDAFRSAAARLRKGDRGVEFPLAAFPPALPFVGTAPVTAG